MWGCCKTPTLIIKKDIMPYKKILLIGGTHGNELTGIKLVKYLLKNPILGIEPIIANKKATNKKVRFIDTDLNRSCGKTELKTHEEKLSKILRPKIMAADFVIEFHNTTAKNNTCAIVTSVPNLLHYSLASYFGVQKILIMPPNGSLSGFRSTRFFSLEISNHDSQLKGIKYLTSKLAGINGLRLMNRRRSKVYKYANILITKTDAKEKGIIVTQLKNFRKFSSREKGLLGLPRDKKFCPIFIGEKAYGKSFGFYIAEII